MWRHNATPNFFEQTPLVPPSKERIRETIHLQSLEGFQDYCQNFLLHHLWLLHYYKYGMISLSGILQCGFEYDVGRSVNEEHFVLFSFPFSTCWMKLLWKYVNERHLISIKHYGHDVWLQLCVFVHLNTHTLTTGGYTRMSGWVKKIKAGVKMWRLLFSQGQIGSVWVISRGGRRPGCTLLWGERHVEWPIGSYSSVCSAATYQMLKANVVTGGVEFLPLRQKSVSCFYPALRRKASEILTRTDSEREVLVYLCFN